MKLLTRREIIALWQKQPDVMLDSLCCPNCRDILFEDEDSYFCDNIHCEFGHVLKSEVDVMKPLYTRYKT